MTIERGDASQEQNIQRGVQRQAGTLSVPESWPCFLSVALLQECLWFAQHFLPLGSLPKSEVKYLQASPSQSLLPFHAFSVPSVPPEPGHLGKRMFCRRNLEMCRCWEAGPCISWQFPSTEFHQRQATETAVRNFILMSTFICNQQVANGEVLMLPSLHKDSPGLWQIWKRLLFFQTLYFPHFLEVQK